MKTSNRDVIQIFWQHTLRYKWSGLVAVLAIIIAVATEAIFPWILKLFIDLLTVGVRSQETLSGLVTFLLILLGLNAIGWISWRIVGFLTLYLQPRVMRDLYLTSFDYLLGHSYQFFTNNFAGSLVRKVGRISRSYERLADEFMFKMVPVFVILTGTFLGLFLRFPQIAFIFLVWVIVFFVCNYFASLWKLKVDIRRAEIDSEATGALVDALTNTVTIRSFTGAKYEFKRFAKVMYLWRKFQSWSWFRNEIIFSAQSILMVGVYFGLMYYGVILWMQGIFSVGDLVLIQGYLTIVFSKLWDVGRSFRNVFESLADANEMVEILKTPHAVRDRRGAKQLIVSKGGIEFKKVRFNFHKTRMVLDDFSLKIASHEKVALVGPSGAGKSTIIKLLFRFYDLHGGKIEIDKQDISRVTQESLREAVAIVPQEPILFHRTISENIQYGKRDASDEEVISASKKARCHDFITELPDGYETYVGERGVKLSGGERQRVAIARAILKNAPILVLDEATSSLDSESERLIQEALEELMRDKTTIVIAHRLSTIMQMDRIIVVEKGRVIATGKHDDLLKKKGTYRTLWEIQAGGFIA